MNEEQKKKLIKFADENIIPVWDECGVSIRIIPPDDIKDGKIYPIVIENNNTGREEVDFIPIRNQTDHFVKIKNIIKHVLTHELLDSIDNNLLDIEKNISKNKEKIGENWKF